VPASIPYFLNAARQDRLSDGNIGDYRIFEDDTPDWEVLNFYAGHNWRLISVNAVAENLLDETYKTYGLGVYSYGRSAWISRRLTY